MKAKRMSIRRVSRHAEVDPSFFAKVLRGERNPPDDERVLRRLADALAVEPEDLLLSVGRLPAEWRAKADRPEVLAALKRVFGAQSGEPAAVPKRAVPAPVQTKPSRSAPPAAPVRAEARRELSEDLL